MAKEETKAFTVQAVPVTVRQLFDEEKARREKKGDKITNPELLQMMIEAFVNPPELNVKFTELQQEKEALAAENDHLQKRNKGLSDEFHIVMEQIDRVNTLLKQHFDESVPVELRKNPAQTITQAVDLFIECLNEKITFENTVKSELSVFKDDLKKAVVLTDHQFVCTLNEVVAKNARKCRPLLIESGLIKESDPKKDPYKFPSDLANLGIHNLLTDHFAEIIAKE